MSNEQELRELQAEVKRLTERVNRVSWTHPHDVVRQALGAVDFIRSHYGSGGRSVELTREIVDMLKAAAVARTFDSQTGAAAAVIYGAAELIEGAYLGLELNQKVYAYRQQKELEELRAKQAAAKAGDQQG